MAIWGRALKLHSVHGVTKTRAYVGKERGRGASMKEENMKSRTESNPEQCYLESCKIDVWMDRWLDKQMNRVFLFHFVGNVGFGDQLNLG